MKGNKNNKNSASKTSLTPNLNNNNDNIKSDNISVPDIIVKEEPILKVEEEDTPSPSASPSPPLDRHEEEHKSKRNIEKVPDGMSRFGTKEEVYNGKALKTKGGLRKDGLITNARGKVVSKSKHEQGKKSIISNRSTKQGTGK